MGSKTLATIIIAVIIGILAFLYNRLNAPLPGPVVRISTGDIQGTLAKSRGGRIFHQFRGIPYAEPPLGKLRFEPPVPKGSWEGVRDASSLGSQCIQANPLINSSLVGSEDCLFLNVFAPKFSASNFSTTPLPVFVFIHGGYFMMGGADHHTPQYFMDEDVVLVTLNHRLASLGFLNTGDGTVRGNMGLKDQTLVLVWVRDNIHKFGGNPENVVLFGESAGAAAVHFHMLSPMSKGLFHKAISQSGTANKASSLASQPKEQAQRLARLLNCPTEIVREMVDCLKSVEAEDIIAIHREANSPLRNPLYMFAPTVEQFFKDAKDTFISDLPINLLVRNGKTDLIPWIVGVNSAEGLLFSGRIMQEPHLIHEFEKNTDEHFPILFGYNKNRKEIAERIRNFYLGTTKDKPNFSFVEKFENYTDLFSDIFYNYGTKEAALIHSEFNPTYLYYNNYETEFSLADFFSIKPGSLPYIISQVLYKKTMEWINRTFYGILPQRYGVCHTDELSLLFQFQMSEIGPNSRDFKMSTNLVHLWVQFAKDHNNMKFFGVPWMPVKPNEKPPRYFQFSNVTNGNRMVEEPFTKRLNFLKTLNI